MPQPWIRPLLPQRQVDINDVFVPEGEVQVLEVYRDANVQRLGPAEVSAVGIITGSILAVKIDFRFHYPDYRAMTHIGVGVEIMTMKLRLKVQRRHAS